MEKLHINDRHLISARAIRLIKHNKSLKLAEHAKSVTDAMVATGAYFALASTLHSAHQLNSHANTFQLGVATLVYGIIADVMRSDFYYKDLAFENETNQLIHKLNKNLMIASAIVIGSTFIVPERILDGKQFLIGNAAAVTCGFASIATRAIAEKTADMHLRKADNLEKAMSFEAKQMIRTRDNK